MPKMVIEVPEEFAEVGKAMVEHLAALQRTVSRLGGGKAVDYAEMEQAMAESAGRTELAGQRAILQSLDMDLPAVIIGGVRYTRVGRCEAPYHTMVGSVSVERSWYRQSGERGGQPGGRVVDAVRLRAGVVEDGWLPRRRGRWPMRCSKARRGKRKRARASLAGYRIRAPVSSGWPPWSGLWPLRITRTWKTP